MGARGRDEEDDAAHQLAEDVTRIARVLLAPGTTTEILDRIATLAVTCIPQCAAAGMCQPGAGDLPQTSPLLLQMEQWQTGFGEGPCVDALAGSDVVYAEDLASDPRWPRFGPAAAATGLRSALAYRLFSYAETLGALHLYTREPGGFSTTDRAQGTIFAAHAGLALALARDHTSAHGRVVHLELALDSRDVIGQAQGILMERERITAAQAFDLLRNASQTLHIKLRDVAQEIVETGAIPR